MESCRKRSASAIEDDNDGVCLPFRIVYIKNGTSKMTLSKADALLAKEMNSLTLDERERVFEDIHAVPRSVDESPQFLEKMLLEMNDSLERIKRKSAYDKAYFLSPDYVENPNFRLMFLRSQEFNAKKAAMMFAAHFERKLQLFGSDKLTKDIDFDDLTPDDQAALLTGSIQFLPVKDRSGRTVVCNSQKHQNYKHWVNHMRVYWYLVMSTLVDNVDAQRLGLVVVVYFVGSFESSDFDKDMMTNGMDFSRALPIRFNALHYCYNDTRLFPMITFAKLIVDTSTRLRFRAHFGSHLECQYELVTYGIPRNTLPFDTEGGLLLDQFKRQIEKRKELEAIQRSKDSNVLRPGKYDVLLGRGRPYQEYEGNLYLADIIDMNRSRYQAGGRGQKSVISEEIVKEIQNLGGRFLKKTEDFRSWVEVSDEVARDKVGHGFRTKTRRSSQSDQPNPNQSPVSLSD